MGGTSRRYRYVPTAVAIIAITVVTCAIVESLRTNIDDNIGRLLEDPAVYEEMQAAIATLRRLYPHLTKKDVKQMRTYHSCGDCHPLPEHLSREPRRTDQP